MPNPKTFENPLPDNVGCGCTSMREALDKVLAEVQRRLQGGECVNGLFMEAAMWGLVGNALGIADELSLLGDEIDLAELRAAMLPHVTQAVLGYATGVIAASWDSPPDEEKN